MSFLFKLYIIYNYTYQLYIYMLLFHKKIEQ
jgi:hypothetical protein